MNLFFAILSYAVFLAVLGVIEVILLDKIKIKGRSIIDWMFYFAGYAFK